MSAKLFITPLEGVSFEQIVRALSRDFGFTAVTARRQGKTSAKNSTHDPAGGLFSVVASNPSASFSMSGAFVTIDGHTVIDTPREALEKFLCRVNDYPSDPYLPFACGAIGYVGFEGLCALAGFEPAKGFSRFPQARFGIYETAAIFDHAENTAFVVSTAETESTAERSAKTLAEKIAALPPLKEIPANEGVSWRAEPNDKQFIEMLKEAGLWLKAEIAKNIHVARCFSKPAAAQNALHEFFAPKNISSIRAIFGHEDAFVLAVSGQTHGTSTNNLMDLISNPKSAGEPPQSAASFIHMGENFHRVLYGGMFGLLDFAGAKFYSAEAVKIFADGAVKVIAGMNVTRDTDLYNPSNIPSPFQ